MVRARRRYSEERQTAKNKDGTENARRAATGEEQRVKRRRKKEREREKEEEEGRRRWRTVSRRVGLANG